MFIASFTAYVSVISIHHSLVSGVHIAVVNVTWVAYNSGLNAADND
jgi:hypothetical protein